MCGCSVVLYCGKHIVKGLGGVYIRCHVKILGRESVKYVYYSAYMVGMRVGSYNIIQRVVALIIYVGYHPIAVLALSCVN